MVVLVYANAKPLNPTSKLGSVGVCHTPITHSKHVTTALQVVRQRDGRPMMQPKVSSWFGDETVGVQKPAEYQWMHQDLKGGDEWVAYDLQNSLSLEMALRQGHELVTVQVPT